MGLLLLLVLLSGQALAQGESTEVLDERFPDITEPQFRLMERLSFPGELLRIARSGEDERLRAESVGALEDFLDDPAVRGWLEEARTSDPSEKVRRLAERALY